MSVPEYRSHISWNLGENHNPGVSIRAFGGGDIAQSVSLFHQYDYRPSVHRLVQAVNHYGYQLRGATCNKEYALMVSLSRHGPKWNDIKAFGATDDLLNRVSVQTILLPTYIKELQTELPHLPTRFWVTRSLDHHVSKVLKSLGFFLVEVSDGGPHSRGETLVYCAKRLFTAKPSGGGGEADKASDETQVSADVPVADQ